MSRSLEGITIVVTRTKQQSGSFTSKLIEKGARVIEIPTIEIVPVESTELDCCIQNITSYDWLFFTSVNSVDLFFKRFNDLEQESGVPKICAIGPATRQRVEEQGFSVELQPRLYQAEGILDEFMQRYDSDLRGISILLPRARVARDILPTTLAEMGAKVDLVPVYETVIPEKSARLLNEALETVPIDLVTFTSSSTVKNFLALTEDRERLRNLRYGAIGPITAETARENGLTVEVMPSEYTIPAFLESIEAYFN